MFPATVSTAGKTPMKARVGGDVSHCRFVLLNEELGLHYVQAMELTVSLSDVFVCLCACTQEWIKGDLFSLMLWASLRVHTDDWSHTCKSRARAKVTSYHRVWHPSTSSQSCKSGGACKRTGTGPDTSKCVRFNNRGFFSSGKSNYCIQENTLKKVLWEKMRFIASVWVFEVNANLKKVI